MVKVNTSQSFSLDIEKIVQEKNIEYMEAVVLYCSENDMEIETAAKLLNTKIREQLEVEYASLNYLPKANTLPI